MAVADLVTTSDVQTVLGSDASTPTEIVIPAPAFTLDGCVWTSSDGTLTVLVGPRNLSKDAFDTAMKATTLATPVSGIGDSAYSIQLDTPQGMSGAAAIVALKNGLYFTVQATHKSGSSQDMLQVITTLAQSIAGRIQ